MSFNHHADTMTGKPKHDYAMLDSEGELGVIRSGDDVEQGFEGVGDPTSGLERSVRGEEGLLRYCQRGFSSFCHQCADIDDTARSSGTAGGQIDEDERFKKILFTSLETGLAGTFCYFFQFIIHNKYCDWLFNCGCTWNWEGGWVDCNFHNTDGKPKCPWCNARQSLWWTTDTLPFLMMFAMYIYMLYNRRKRCNYILARVAAAVSTYFVGASLIGLVYFIGAPDYKYFAFLPH